VSMRGWTRTRPQDATRQPTMKPIDPIFDFLTVTWDAAAQEAAFEGHCFCMLDTGRLVNSQSMPVDTPHWNRPAYQSVARYKRALRPKR
jgi:hypothetical protein